MRVLLPRDTPGPDDDPALPLADPDQIEAFFDALARSGPMSGWSSLDDQDLTPH